MIKQNNDEPGSNVERERETKEMRRERGNRDREMACKHSGILTESESALHGEERMEQLNNRKD